MQVVVVPHAMCQCTQHNMHLHCTGLLLIAHQHACTETQPEQHAPPSKIPEHRFNPMGYKGEQEPHHQPAPIRATRIRRSAGRAVFGHPGISAPSFVGRSQDRRPKRQAYLDPEQTHRVSPNGKKKTSKEAKGGKPEERRTHHRWFLGIMAWLGAGSFVPTSCRTIPSHATYIHVCHYSFFAIDHEIHPASK